MVLNSVCAPSPCSIVDRRHTKEASLGSRRLREGQGRDAHQHRNQVAVPPHPPADRTGDSVHPEPLLLLVSSLIPRMNIVVQVSVTAAGTSAATVNISPPETGHPDINATLTDG